MKITIKKNLDMTPSLATYVEEKLGTIEKFVEHFDKGGMVELRLELSRTTQHHHKGGEVFSAVADLRLPGKILRAEEYAENVRKAIDRAKDTLKLEIEKYKTKMIEKERE